MVVACARDSFRIGLFDNPADGRRLDGILSRICVRAVLVHSYLPSHV